MLEQTLAREAGWFNKDENFRSSWNAALDLKNESVAEWWLPVMLGASGDNSFFKLLSKQQALLTKGAVEHAALGYAKRQGLIREALHEVGATGETVLMRIAAAGDALGLRILVTASADVTQKDKVGITHHAILCGFVQSNYCCSCTALFVV